MSNDSYNKNQVNLVDLFFYLLGNWFWFALCVIVCVGFAYYRYSKMPLVYRSDATIIIKDPSNTRSTVQMNAYSQLINGVSMSNEILQLKSRELMRQVVLALDADIDYKVPVKLRQLEYYRESPVRMYVSREPEMDVAMELRVTPQDSAFVQVLFSSGESYEVMLGDTLHVQNGWLCFHPTKSYGPEWFGE
jgi:hypothetical protein